MTLHEALTGKVPIEGPPHAVLQAKSSFVPKSLRASGTAISPELDALVTGLLQPNPARRPDGAAVLASLGALGTAQRAWMAPAPPRLGSQPFLGREPELARLRERLAEVQTGTPRIVTIEGQSGIGKTSLVRRFLEELDANAVLILRSRCHPQETVAFNAIDGLIDEFLCGWLAELPSASTLFPEGCHELLRLFPALATFAGSQAAEPEAGPAYSRRHAFAQLQALLRAVAETRTLVLWVDDLQWGDEESGVLLRELLASKDAPEVLAVACVRAEDRQHSACLRVLAGSKVERLTDRIALPPLGDEESVQLVRSISRGAEPIDREAVEELVRQSRGSPFLLAELGRYLAGLSPGPGHAAEGGIGDVLAQRTEPLHEDARRALEVLAVAGSPLEQESARRAAGLGEGYREVYAALERLFLVRTVDTRHRAVEVYHHQIRDVVLRRMTEATRADRHRAIGHALVLSARPNVIAAIDHFEAGGDVDSVRRYVVPAADEAARVFAFERAARHYHRALELGGSGTPLEELERRLAVALASGGRGREAGEAYVRAASTLERRGNADAQHVLELRYRAAEQFIQTGHEEKGSSILREVLERVGIPLPRTRGAAVGKTIALRLSTMAAEAAGVGPDVSATPRDLWRFDAMRAVGMRLAVVDHAMADYASARCMKDAMAIGDVTRLVRALASEATTWSHLPPKFCQRRGLRLLERATALLPPGADPYDRACLLGSTGIAASFRGECRKTASTLGEAIALLRAHSPGRAWEISLWRVWQLWALGQLGELRELRRLSSEDSGRRARAGRLLHGAQRDPRRGARLAGRRSGRGAARARRRLAEGRSPGLRDRALPVLRHRDGGRALPWPVRDCVGARAGGVAALKANGFLLLASVRDELLHLRARAALGAAGEGVRASQGLRPIEPLADALSAAARMEAHGLAAGRGWAILLAPPWEAPGGPR